MDAKFNSGIKRITKKIFSKPFPTARLIKRTLSSAIMVIERLDGVDYTEITVSLHDYLSGLKCDKRIISQLESQIELAGANPTRFVENLHKFYSEFARFIKSEDLYEDMFGLVQKCIEDDLEVMNPFINIILQSLEYLKPNKFAFDEILCGRSTDGELMLIKDPSGNIDMPDFRLTEMAVKNRLPAGRPEDLMISQMRQAGFVVNSFDDCLKRLAMASTWDNNVFEMAALINEFTFDMLPTVLYEGHDWVDMPVTAKVQVEQIQEVLLSRRRTLPANGVVVNFTGAGDIKSLKLKEILFNNEVVMLYKMGTAIGEFSGYYKTLQKKFMSVFWRSSAVHVHKRLEQLILWVYAAIVCDSQSVAIDNFGKVFWFGTESTPSAKASMFGGPAMDTYRKRVTDEVDESRYDREMRSVNGFVRKLPTGMEASNEAVIAAAELGFKLERGETFVRPFKKTVRTLKEV